MWVELEMTDSNKSADSFNALVQQLLTQLDSTAVKRSARAQYEQI